MTEKKFKLTKSPGSLNVLTFGDVHLGNSRNKAHEMLPGLLSLLPRSEKEWLKLDAIMIEGDLFDESLPFNYDGLSSINAFLVILVKKCIKHNVILRTLEGTPSHDNKQTKYLLTLIENMGVGDQIDYKHFDTLAIEEHPILGSIMYVPDEWSTSMEHTYEEAVKLLSVYGLDQVDMILMHGAFDYQLPPPTHNREAWEKLVRYVIMIGHVHTRSQLGKVVASGSTDRCEHGNEEPKGASWITIRAQGFVVEFIENKFTKTFKTIDCGGLSVEETMAKIREYGNEPPGSYLRLRVRHTDNASHSLKFISAEFPDFIWDCIYEKTDKEFVNTEGVLPKLEIKSLSVNRSNLASIVLDFARQKFREESPLTEGDEHDLRMALEELCQEAQL